MKTISYFMFAVLLCMTSCSKDDTTKDETPVDVDFSKSTINESESNAYNSVFEVKFTQDNVDYVVKLKTTIYDYDKLAKGQSINETIENATLVYDDIETPVKIESGNIKVDNVGADKLSLNFDNVVIAKTAINRGLDINKFLINRTISYLRDKKTMDFTVDGKKAVIGTYTDIFISNSATTQHNTEFQAVVNDDKFYTVCKKNTGQYLVKGYVLNSIFDFIYCSKGDFTLKKGTIVLYDINDKKDKATIFYDNVTLVCNEKEMKINGLIKYGK